MITAAMRHQLSLGITSTNDAGVGPELLATYRRMDEEERLPSRINVMALGRSMALTRRRCPRRAICRIDSASTP